MSQVARRRSLPLIVTTSWDDGHRFDLVTASVLQRHGMTGTFYVSPRNRETPARDRLTAAELRTLAETHEVGSHTLTHPRLTDVSDGEAAREIEDGKRELEDTLEGEVLSFAYPGGAYHRRHVAMVAAAGCTFGRTTQRWVRTRHQDPLRAGTTMHAYRHLRDVAIAAGIATVHVGRATRLLLDWGQLARVMFDRAYADGEVFHIWGHSWEIAAQRDWARLDDFLGYVAAHENIRHVTNRQLATRGGEVSQP